MRKSSAPPSKPENLDVVRTDKGLISIAWDPPKDIPNAYTPVGGYVIEMATGVKDNFVQVAEVDANVREFTATGLKDEKKYNFRVRAKNEAGVSEAYNQLKKPVKAIPLVGETPIDSSFRTTSTEGPTKCFAGCSVVLTVRSVDALVNTAFGSSDTFLTNSKLLVKPVVL